MYMAWLTDRTTESRLISARLLLLLPVETGLL
jgi:hypothetical protein